MVERLHPLGLGELATLVTLLREDGVDNKKSIATTIKKEINWVEDLSSEGEFYLIPCLSKSISFFRLKK